MPTKLGAHVLRSTGGLSEFLEAGAAVVKFVGEWGMARNVPDGVLIIGRKYQGDYDAQLQRATGKTPLEGAEQFVGDQLSAYSSNPSITHWEGHNEPVWNTPEEMAWFAQFEVERMRLMAERGLKCVIGNFATGTPGLDLWPAFLPALRAAASYQAILGVHEYSCPWMWWMTGKYQLDPEEDEGDEGWTTLRYRKVYRQHLIPNDVGSVPLVITECGLDPLVNPKPPGADGGAWKKLGRFWAENDGERDKADYYFRQLVWYDKEMQRDEYVVGATIFTWGSFGPPWSDFDVGGSEVADKLVAYAQSDPASPFAYPDLEPRGGDYAPEKARGHPRLQYARTYVLLPPNAGAEWARAVVDGAWDEKRYTIGGIVDDAGIGDLDERRVIAVNPHEWAGTEGSKGFFEEHYPGVEYEPITASTPAELAQELANA